MPDDITGEEAKKLAIEQARNRYEAIVKSASDFKASSIKHAVEMELAVVKDAKAAIASAQQQLKDGKGPRGLDGAGVISLRQSQVTIIENAVNNRKQIEAMASAIEKATIQRAEQEMKEAIKKAEDSHRSLEPAPSKAPAVDKAQQSTEREAPMVNRANAVEQVTKVQSSDEKPAVTLVKPAPGSIAKAAVNETITEKPSPSEPAGQVQETARTDDSGIKISDRRQVSEKGAKSTQASPAEIFATGRNVRLIVRNGFKKHHIIALERALREWPETRISMTIGSGDNVEYFIQIREPVALEEKLLSLPFIDIVSNQKGELTLAISADV